MLVLALSPLERLQAVRSGLSGPNILRDRWFILIAGLAILILAISLVVLRKKQYKKFTAFSANLFDAAADRWGLNEDERELLLEAANNSCPQSPILIFESSEFFDKGTAWILNKGFKDGYNLEQRKKLYLKFSDIKNKIGLTKPTYKNTLRASKSNNMTSRNVRVGAAVRLIDDKNPTLKYQAEIVDINEIELWLKPQSFVEVEPGQIWRIHYQCGACVWEFLSGCIGVEQGNLILCHSEDVKFINRRRFQRVGIKRNCKIALFDNQVEFDWDLPIPVPQFYDALVIELSGPGLQILSDIEFKSGQRLLIVADIEKGLCVQDVAEVRHSSKHNGKNVIAVELIGLDDAALAKLVKLTNKIALSSKPGLEIESDELIGVN